MRRSYLTQQLQEKSDALTTYIETVNKLVGHGKGITRETFRGLIPELTEDDMLDKFLFELEE